MSCGLHPQWIHDAADCPFCSNSSHEWGTRDWHTDKPPHGVVVEVEHQEKIVQAVAIWGDPEKGILPHWEIFDGSLFHPQAFKRWRHLG